MYFQPNSHHPFRCRSLRCFLTPLFVISLVILAAAVGSPHLAFADDAEPEAVVAGQTAETTQGEEAPTGEGRSDKAVSAVTVPEENPVVAGETASSDEPTSTTDGARATGDNPAVSGDNTDRKAGQDSPADDSPDSMGGKGAGVDSTGDKADGTADTPNASNAEQNAVAEKDGSVSQGNIAEEKTTVTEADAQSSKTVTEEQGKNSSTAETTETAIAESIASQLKPVVKRLAASKSTTSTDPFVIVIDAGHGGFDSGAVGNGLQEHALNLSIAKYIQQLLQGYANVVVYLTRTSNTSFTSETKTDLLARVNFAVNHKADVFISVHTNSGPSAAHGVEVIAQNDSSYRYALHTESMGLANAVFNAERAIRLASHSGVYTRDYGSGAEGKYPDGSNADYLSLLRNCRKKNIPAILIENLFISNASDAAYLSKPANRKKIAQAIVNGIVKYYGLSKNLVSDDKGLRYLNNDKTYAQNTFKTVNGKTYYFGDNTYAVRYAQTINGKMYYFTSSYQMKTGWLTWKADGTRSYFEPSKSNSKYGYGVAHAGFDTIGGKTYYFDPTKSYHSARYTRTIDGAMYYFSKAGVMKTGWLTWKADGSRSYFEQSNTSSEYTYGAAHTGWDTIGTSTYYFNPSKSNHSVRYVQTIEGKRYYFSRTGVRQNGWITWKASGTRSYFGKDGAAVSGWKYDGAKRYYISPKTFRTVRYAQTIGGKKYYFNKACVMHTGWLTWKADGSRSYFYANKKSANYGVMLYGEQTISGMSYDFGTSGKYYPQSIMGATQTTVAQMVRHYLANVGSGAYPTNVYTSKGAKTINDFCRLIYEEATAEGVRAEVLYTQAMLETGYLQFGGDVKPRQCNFGGIGATGNGVPGNSFKDVRTGLRAQTQHLKAYASTESLNNACVDPRFSYVKRGCAPTIDGLTGTWAASSKYADSLKSILNSLLAA